MGAEAGLVGEDLEWPVECGSVGSLQGMRSLGCEEWKRVTMSLVLNLTL